MNDFDDLVRTVCGVIRAAGCRLIGCIVLALALAAATCALATLGALTLIRPAHAETLVPQLPARRYSLLVDQSGSVAGYATTQALARETTLALVRNLRLEGDAEDVLELVFFGAQPRLVISPTHLNDAQLDARILEAFARSYSMGGTRFDLAFALALERSQAGSVVIVISDGVPETGAPLMGQARQAHVATLKQQAEQFAARRIPLFLCLLNREPQGWSELWPELTGLTGGGAVVARNAKDAQRAAQVVAAAARRLGPGATPTVMPTRTPVPSATPAPTIVPSATPSPVPAATPMLATAPDVVRPTPLPTAAAVREPEWASRFDLPAVALGCLAGVGGVCALALAVMLSILAVMRRGLARAPAAATHVPADEGCLEIYDPETDAVQRIELRSHAMGEVLTIGCASHCDIQLNADLPDRRSVTRAALDSSADEPLLADAAPSDASLDDAPMAALVLAPDGPRIESRNAPLYFDGHSVRQHRLFDNDVLYLDRFVLYYHNFFRQRAVDESADL
ncbi:MAG: VWA domain-containing protein [Anaerolineae bacterium]|nr:VWA domain-containing protein [Candidatus Roseilinea sp.]MDW8449266.1 VWA domain-containing protein [Anaerolineae bacterium]